MNEKIILELKSCLRNNLDSVDQFELVLQILAWAKLSRMHSIPEELKLKSSVLSDPSKALEIIAQLSQREALLQQAFSAEKRISRVDPITLVPLLELVIRMNETGVLQSFNPVDAINVMPWFTGTELAMPNEVAELLTGLADVTPEMSAYIPWDFGGQLAVRMANADHTVYQEQPQVSPIPALISLLSKKPYEVHCTDPIRKPSAIANGRPRKFDVAVSFPPIGLRYEHFAVERDLFGRFFETTTSGTILSIRHLLAHAKQRIVIAVPNSLLFSSGAEQSLRQEMVSNGIVQTVIAMPSGLMAGTSIPFTVLVLDSTGNQKAIQFINADSPSFRKSISKAKSQLINIATLIGLVKNPVDSENSVQISKEEVLNNNAQLQVNRYLLADSSIKIQSILANSPTIVLEDLTKTIRPFPNASHELDGIEIHEVGAADIPSAGYINTTARTIKVGEIAASRNEQLFLRPLDIVMIVKGSVGKVGIVPYNVPSPGEGGWVAGQSAIVLRCAENSPIDPRVLALQLRSPFGQELLAGIVSGATIKLIQLRELIRLQVLVPDAETTAKAIAALESEARLQQDINTLIAEQASLAANLWTLE